MTIIKPGQLITIEHCVYQAKKRVCGCKGCDLDSIDRCPRIVDKRFGNPKYDCNTYRVILKRI